MKRVEEKWWFRLLERRFASDAVKIMLAGARNFDVIPSVLDEHMLYWDANLAERMLLGAVQKQSRRRSRELKREKKLALILSDSVEGWKLPEPDIDTFVNSAQRLAQQKLQNAIAQQNAFVQGQIGSVQGQISGRHGNHHTFTGASGKEYTTISDEDN
jgi:hypothetical protein